MDRTMLVDKNGEYVNPSREETLSEILNTLKFEIGLYSAIKNNVFIANDEEEGVADGDYVYYLITPSQNSPVYLKYVRFYSEGDLLITVYVNPQITDAGEAVRVFPVDDRKSITPNTQVTKYPSWNDMGSIIEQVYLSGNGNYAFPNDLFRDRILTKQYLVAIQNVSGNNLKYLALEMRFAEGME